MFKTIINAWKVKDIRTKMLYTLLLIVVYRLGSFIPVPSVNGEKLGELIASYDFLSFLNLFSGGSLNNFSLFAMGISPYITASIILQTQRSEERFSRNALRNSLRKRTAGKRSKKSPVSWASFSLLSSP